MPDIKGSWFHNALQFLPYLRGYLPPKKKGTSHISKVGDYSTKAPFEVPCSLGGEGSIHESKSTRHASACNGRGEWESTWRVRHPGERFAEQISAKMVGRSAQTAFQK